MSQHYAKKVWSHHKSRDLLYSESGLEPTSPQWDFHGGEDCEPNNVPIFSPAAYNLRKILKQKLSLVFHLSIRCRLTLVKCTWSLAPQITDCNFFKGFYQLHQLICYNITPRRGHFAACVLLSAPSSSGFHNIVEDK